MLRQKPDTWENLIRFKGDTISFYLFLSETMQGRAYLRTTLGRGAIAREEIINQVESGQPHGAHAWHDVRMRKLSDLEYRITVPLTEVGCFKAKCLFVPAGSDQPMWPEGDNVSIKVEPADTYASNTIYSAFIRQFGIGKSMEDNGASDSAINRLEDDGYTVIPPSGKFRDFIGKLDFIIKELGFRIIQLLPIHPVPTTYARMGRLGSPFAALDLMAVDPALAEFDQAVTPLGQFRELVDEVHARAAKIFLDIPINHTGWASNIQNQHPEWFARDENNAFESPGAWGITWEDLVKLSYNNKDLWRYVADMFLFWCRQGVDGFRCDAGYMIPFEVWEYVAAKVRMEYPDMVFILEGLGGKIATTESLIGEGGLNWAYSELFQNYDRGQIEKYLPLSIRISQTKGLLTHFAETHDNNRLAAVSRQYSRMRTGLAALFSYNGAFGITNGVEWFADRKIDVHDMTPLNWGCADNQTDHINRLNRILESHPSFHGYARLRLIHVPGDNAIALLRESIDVNGSRLLVVVNLDADQPGEIRWRADDFDVTGKVIDLFSGGEEKRPEIEGDIVVCQLDAAEVLCLTLNPKDLANMNDVQFDCSGSAACIKQLSKAKALEIITRFGFSNRLDEADLDAEARRLRSDPEGFCRSWKSEERMNEVVQWQWPRDSKRVVMISSSAVMVLRAATPFIVELKDGGRVLQHERSLAGTSGDYFAVIFPVEESSRNRMLGLSLTVYDGGQTTVSESWICQLANKIPDVEMSLLRQETIEREAYALCTNGKGAMAQVRGEWGQVRSQYDALLAANLDPERPSDSHVMFTRCRAWLSNQGYWQDVGADFLEHFSVCDDESVTWQFRLPCGRGRFVSIIARLKMLEGENAIVIVFRRLSAGSRREAQEDSQPVDIIVRPDIEDRTCHGKTKAYQGAEKHWAGAVEPLENGFVFAPVAERRLQVRASAGVFTYEPEWTYMVAHPVDQERGLDGFSDLFSPGYLKFSLKGGESVKIFAGINVMPQKKLEELGSKEAHSKRSAGLLEVVKKSINNFVVDREGLKTVIAGYPWFLDWGRDTLICLRGMIAAGMLRESELILRRFAHFEVRGTLPNTIHGEDIGNRDTSDAPLWLIVALHDYIRAVSDKSILEVDCGGRKMREIVCSIIDSYMEGAGNGIKMDMESGLVFSPAHYTWMDTNYPAGTPRQGYPVEIQALWYASLSCAADYFDRSDYAELAGKVKKSFLEYFWGQRPKGISWLSDCLHCNPGEPASVAKPDDALRPNQLFAITMGAIDESDIARSILVSCEELLVPGALRSLADRPVTVPVPVFGQKGLLNDQSQPYWGHYSGDEDTRRKPAYHNGTAWTWLFPVYCESLLMTYGEKASSVASGLLGSSADVLGRGCLGHMPEILDGDAPHRLKGCGAQAWAATELYRILALCMKT